MRPVSAATPLDDGSWLLSYRAPYHWPGILAFFRTRAIPGLELVGESTYSRIIEVGGGVGSVEIADAPERSGLRVCLAFEDSAAQPEIFRRLRRMFDLDNDPQAVAEVLARDPRLAPMVAARPGLRVPGAWDGLEIAIRAILGQQVTVRAATVLASRMVATLGHTIPAAISRPGLTHTFPKPERLTAEAVAALGMPRARAAAIAGVAAAAQANPALFEPGYPDLSTAIEHMRALPGIGDWTAHYIGMRVLREADAFPAGDVALQRILAVGGQRPTAKALLAESVRWSPWRAYAVLQIWMSEALAG